MEKADPDYNPADDNMNADSSNNAGTNMSTTSGSATHHRAAGDDIPGSISRGLASSPSAHLSFTNVNIVLTDLSNVRLLAHQFLASPLTLLDHPSPRRQHLVRRLCGSHLG